MLWSFGVDGCLELVGALEYLLEVLAGRQMDCPALRAAYEVHVASIALPSMATVYEVSKGKAERLRSKCYENNKALSRVIKKLFFNFIRR